MSIFPNSSPQPQNCTSISNQGSVLLIGALADCETEPSIVTLTASATAIGATTITVTDNLPTGGKIYLRKGAILNFGTNKKVVVAAETLVDAATANTVVPIEFNPTAIVAGDQAQTWGLLKILAPQTIPLNEEASTEDISDLTNGLQGSETVVKLMLNPQIQIISRLDDRAYHEIIANAAKVGGLVYCVFAMSDTSHVFGHAIVSGNNREFTQMNVNKPSFNLLMQSPRYSYGAFKYQNTTDQGLINLGRNLAGLSALV